MGWLIALGVLTALSVLPLGICAIYDSSGAVLRLILGPVRRQLYPRPPKEKMSKTEKKKQPSATEKKSSETQKKKGGGLKEFYPLLERILELLYTFKSKLRVDRLELKLILASDDPADLAQNYGRAWAVLGNVMPHLERVFVIKKRDLQVECDFAAAKTLIYARLDLTITLGRLLGLITVHGFRILREYFKITKNRKGGAKS